MDTNIANFTIAGDNTSNDFPKINTILGRLIENDIDNAIDNRNAPGIWEQTWMTQDEDGYAAGQAVWVNADTIEDIVNLNMNKISSYVMNKPELTRKFMQIDRNNSSEIIKFFRKVASGTAHPQVSALYYVGDIRKCIQIMVSRKDGNKTYPIEGEYWRSLISVHTSADQLISMYETLNDITDQRLSSHMQDYHISRMPPGLVGNLINKDPQTDFSVIQKYYFSSHYYTQYMRGFDYVTDFKYDNGNECWYRQWNSGYLEQGGFIDNIGNPTLNIQFLKNYNYPGGARFYQEGYTSYAGMADNINGSISQSKRYVATVTPVMGRGVGNINPYALAASDPTNTGTYSYVNVDMFKFDNNGFMIVNMDPDQKAITKYSWYVAGFTTKYQESEINTLMRQSYHVDFYDNKDGVIS